MDYTPILVYITDGEVIEVTGKIVGPKGLTFDGPTNRVPDGFYIAHLHPTHIDGPEKYLDARVTFDPIDMQKLARMPGLMREVSDLLRDYPAPDTSKIPERLRGKRAELELALAQAI